jgi:hypothetical protein
MKTMPPPEHNPEGPVPPPAPPLAEIRYSLPALLAELKEETQAASMAMEKLHQAEIGKLFQTRTKRRVKKP